MAEADKPTVSGNAEPAVEQPGTEKEEGEVSPSKEVSESPQKHPLEHSWTLWFDNPQARPKGSEWGSSMRPVYTFSTVEDFWCLYNNVLTPSKIPLKADMHMFKTGIEPKWEDPKCVNGGAWTAYAKDKQKFDDYWLNTLLAMIGEQFEDGEDVCGAVANKRAGKDRVAVWTKTAHSETIQTRIAKQWKEMLDISSNITIGFQSFADAKKGKGGSRDLYSV
eukprot:jgi/Mesen1/1562/ME000134S00678